MLAGSWLWRSRPAMLVVAARVRNLAEWGRGVDDCGIGSLGLGCLNLNHETLKHGRHIRRRFRIAACWFGLVAPFDHVRERSD